MEDVPGLPPYPRDHVVDVPRRPTPLEAAGAEAAEVPIWDRRPGPEDSAERGSEQLSVALGPRPRKMYPPRHGRFR